MKPLALLLPATLLLAACQRQPQLTPDAPGCLQYALGSLTLSGQARSERISAPGKDYRQALVLVLDNPICIHAKAGQEAAFPAHQNLTEIELVPQSDHAAVHALAGQRVTAHGNLAPLSGDGAAAPVGLVLRTIKPDTQAAPAPAAPSGTPEAGAAETITR